MDNLIFRTEDGFLYEESGDSTIINHKRGGYRKDTLLDYMYTDFDVDDEEEQKLFGRMNEILRMVESFKEKVDE